jgi:hypothetical protein
MISEVKKDIQKMCSGEKRKKVCIKGQQRRGCRGARWRRRRGRWEMEIREEKAGEIEGEERF